MVAGTIANAVLVPAPLLACVQGSRDGVAGRVTLDRRGMDEIERLSASGASYHFFLPRAKASSLAWAVDEVAPETVFRFVCLGFLGSRLLRF